MTGVSVKNSIIIMQTIMVILSLLILPIVLVSVAFYIFIKNHDQRSLLCTDRYVYTNCVSHAFFPFVCILQSNYNVHITQYK